MKAECKKFALPAIKARSMAISEEELKSGQNAISAEISP